MARHCIAYISLAIALNAGAAAEAPTAIVTRIYAAYQGDNGRGIGIYDGGAAYFSARRREQIAMQIRSCPPALGLCLPDYQLFVLGQDWQVSKLLIAASQEESGRQLITGQFNSYDRPIKVVFSFIKERENWKIDDVDIFDGKTRVKLDHYLAPHPTFWDMSCWAGTAVSLEESRYGQAQMDLEAKRINDNKGSVSRTSNHELQIKTRNGLMRFVDKAPFVENVLPKGVLSQAGEYYNYCGSFEHYHLIASNFRVFMLDADTAKTLPASPFVLFSPDRRAYLAATGIPGTSDDSSQWFIYDTNGKLAYEGLDSTPVNDRRNAVLTYPLWTAKGELTADARCPKINSMNPAEWTHASVVKLIKSAAGQWSWQPKPYCD